VTTSPWVGRSKPGCDLGPALSFKDVHHPGWGGGRAEPELYLPCGFVGQPLPLHSRERALSGPAGGSDFDNAGLVDGRHRQLQRVGLAGSARGAPSRRKGGCRAARTGGPPKTSRAARAAFVFWGCPAFAPVRHLCTEIGAPLHLGGSEWGSASGQMAPVAGAEVAAGEVLVAGEITATIRARGLRLFVLVLAPRASAWARARLQWRLP
jgi:hypothetical protein